MIKGVSVPYSFFLSYPPELRWQEVLLKTGKSSAEPRRPKRSIGGNPYICPTKGIKPAADNPLFCVTGGDF